MLQIGGKPKVSNAIKTPKKKSSSLIKRNFTVVIRSKEHGLYVSSSPSSAARKAVSKLCATDKKRKVQFHIREITHKSEKKTYGPYLGYIEKLAKPIELKGRVIKYKPIAKLSGKTSKKSVVKKGGMWGGVLWEATDFKDDFFLAFYSTKSGKIYINGYKTPKVSFNDIPDHIEKIRVILNTIKPRIFIRPNNGTVIYFGKPISYQFQINTDESTQISQMQAIHGYLNYYFPYVIISTDGRIIIFKIEFKRFGVSYNVIQISEPDEDLKENLKKLKNDIDEKRKNQNSGFCQEIYDYITGLQ